ncbi:hypothetical protein ACVSUC_04255 [Yersinia enterocolitica]|nr:hypothetical protein [Yersinia enterocolitica]
MVLGTYPEDVKALVDLTSGLSQLLSHEWIYQTPHAVTLTPQSAGPSPLDEEELCMARFMAMTHAIVPISITIVIGAGELPI